MAGGFEIGRDDDSPWASEQPAPDVPIEFEWAPARDAGAEWSASGAPATPEHLPADPHEDPHAGQHVDHHEGDPPEPSNGGPRRRHAVIAGLAVLAVTVGVLTFVRDDSPLDGQGAAGATSTTAADTSTSSTETPVTLAEPPEIVTASSQPTFTASETEPTPTWNETTIPLPPALRAMRVVTTVVLVDSEGLYSEIELPTGRMRSIQLRRSAGTAQLVVGATTSLVATYPGGGGAVSYLLRVGEDPLELRLESDRNEMVAIPTRDEYVATLYDYVPQGSFRETRVYPDGSTETVESTLDDIGPWQQRFSPTGDRLIEDAGGVYRLDEGGAAERISTGLLASISENHLLVRECDEAYDCVYVLIDVRTNERRTVILGLPTNPVYGSEQLSISPDGNHLHYLSFVGGDAGEIIVDLATGDSVSPTPAYGDSSINAWAADSSGVFRPHQRSGMQFVDRTTGDVTSFAQELVGNVTTYAVRRNSDVAAGAPATPVTSGLAVIGLGREGDVHRIDIDTGAVISIDSPPLASGAPAYVLADSQGATIVSYDNVPSIRFDAVAGTAALAGESPSGPLLPGPLPGTVWQQRGRNSQSAPFRLDLVDAAGNELGQVLELVPDAELLGADGTGGVLARAELGGVYRFAIDSPPKRITSGEALAVGAAVAYVRECDDQLVCGVFRLDRATDERVLTEVPALDLAGGDLSAGGPLGQSVSPDGNVALVRVGGFGTEWTIVDLASATAVPVPGAATGSPLLWSADSQWALYLSGDVLRLYDRASGGLRTLSNLPELKAFGAAIESAVPAESGATDAESDATSGESAIVGEPVIASGVRRAPTLR